MLEGATQQDSGAPAPRVTIGLPVYNGEEYLEESLDGLLGQTFEDFELIISDNASTDRTPQICHEYAARDSRIRYVRREANMGAVPNHNSLVPLARGTYFKWASHDDLYAPALLERCLDALESMPSVVLAHVWDGVVDEKGNLTPVPYVLETASPVPHVRLRSLLHVDGGNDFYGVIRMDVLRRVRPLATYLHSDRTFMAQLALHGPFHQVPEVLYYRRDHPSRASRASKTRKVVSTLDPRRSNRLRHPLVRLYLEYVGGFVAAVVTAPIPLRERARCLYEVSRWLVGRMSLSRMRQVLTGSAPSATVNVPGSP
jgi:glycosyltransferase involved in cell wall biosynthesis